MPRSSDYPEVSADMTIGQYVAARMKQARLNAGMTVDALADAVGVHLATVLKWERGSGFPRIPHIEAVARVTGQDIVLVFVGRS